MLILLIISFSQYLKSHDSTAFFYTHLSHGKHVTYLAIFMNLALLFVIEKIYSGKQRNPSFIFLLAFAFLFAGIFLAVSLIYFDIDRKASRIFGIITFGVLFHLFLDWLLVGTVAPFYPFSDMTFGLNLLGRLGVPLAIEGLEAIVLLWWLWHEEKTHKISDFI